MVEGRYPGQLRFLGEFLTDQLPLSRRQQSFLSAGPTFFLLLQRPLFRAFRAAVDEPRKAAADQGSEHSHGREEQ
ncbi:hypothetical protein ABZ848_01610 [Streptomyces sp. NPDC047081]|uniref:hypothetical protein n=1 Tax=Streptomyces sp. NPDC047081 TaxID=3154706 RepID=UPI00340A8A69